MKTSYKFLVLLIVLSIAFAGNQTNAEEINPQNRRLENMEKKEGNMERRCELMQSNIEKRIEMYNRRKDVHKAAYERFLTKVEEIIERLEAKGKDTTQIVQEVEELKALIKEFSTSVETSVTMLEEANDYNCGQSEGEFKTRIQDTKVSFEATRESAKAVREQMKMVKETIREAVKARNTSESEGSE